MNICSDSPNALKSIRQIKPKNIPLVDRINNNQTPLFYLGLQTAYGRPSIPFDKLVENNDYFKIEFEYAQTLSHGIVIRSITYKKMKYATNGYVSWYRFYRYK